MFVVAALFTRLYAKDSQFCTSFSSASLAFVNILFSGKYTLKNIGEGLEDKAKELSNVLVKLRKAFLNHLYGDYCTAFQILDELEKNTTLARNLTDHYPSFKIALGKVVKDNSAPQVGAARN
jgi:hypothetical protein